MVHYGVWFMVHYVACWMVYYGAWLMVKGRGGQTIWFDDLIWWFDLMIWPKTSMIWFDDDLIWQKFGPTDLIWDLIWSKFYQGDLIWDLIWHIFWGLDLIWDLIWQSFLNPWFDLRFDLSYFIGHLAAVYIWVSWLPLLLRAHHEKFFDPSDKNFMFLSLSWHGH